MKKKTKIITVLNLACVLLLILGTTTVADVAAADGPDPRISANLNQNAIAVRWWPEEGINTLELTIDDPETPGIEYTSIDYQVLPHFSGFLLGSEFILQPGQIVTVRDGITEKEKELTVAYISNLIAVDYDNNVISGEAGPGAVIKVWLWDENQRIVTTDENGKWSADFDKPESEKVDLLPWSTAEILVSDEDWDHTLLAWPIYIGVSYEGDSIGGENWFVGQPVTMQIYNPDSGDSVDYEGWPEVGPAVLTNVNFHLWDQDPPYDVQPGNVVTLSQGDLSRSIEVEEINVHFADVIEDKVVGSVSTSKNAHLSAMIEGTDPRPVRFVSSDVSGNWLADFHVPGSHPIEWQTWDITTDTRGYVLLADSDGDHSFKDWQLPFLCKPGYSVSGYVTEADGTTPIDGAVVHFSDVSSPSEDVCIVTVGADGTYSVELPDGTYKLFAEGAGYSRQYYQAAIYENAVQLTVSDSDQHSGINFALDMPNVIYEHFVFNLNDPVLSDPAVRQAIAYGTDRQRMIDETYVHAPVWDSYLPFYHWAYNPDVTTYAYDPLTAAQVLDDAEWTVGTGGIREKAGQSLSFSYVGPINPQREKIRDIFIENMTSLGIEVIDRTDEDPWNLIFNERDFGVAEFAWINDVNDDWSVASNLRADDFGNNVAGYNDPAADQLLDNANAETTRAGKLPYYLQHQAMVMYALPELPLFHRCRPPDSDCDGIVDSMDNAELNFNPDQSDIDGDGVGDVADICPSDSEDTCNANNSTSESVGSSGGSVSTPQGSVQITIPQDALINETSISITDTGSGFGLATNLGDATAVFGVEIGPEGTIFAEPVDITFSWEDIENDGLVDGTHPPAREDNLIITQDNNVITDRCFKEPTCDTSTNTFTFQVSTLSEFALVNLKMADAGGPYLVQAGSSILLNGTGIDTDPSSLNYLWTAMEGTLIDVFSEDPMYMADNEAGIFYLTLTVTDPDDLYSDDDTTFVVVYDPDGGFVTGGGWIDSPEGAYIPDGGLTGKANFGFVSKYKKGANVPEGNTEFQFKAGSLNFHSSSYKWLVVTGSDYARFKGSGTINGAGEYKFMLWAGDKDPDTFRIKIWNEDGDGEDVVYDNGMAQAIGGGNIVVHTKKK